MSVAVEETQTMSGLKRLQTLVSSNYLVFVLIGLCIAIGALRPAFLGAGNLSNVLFQAAFVGLAACGMTLLISAGLLDLSVAGVIALSSITVATVLPVTTIGAAMLLAVVIGAVAGLINGLLVTYIRIPAFIATLGTLNLFVGISFIWTKGQVIPISSTNYRSATTGTIGLFPVAFLVFIALAVLSWFLLNRTYFGRMVRSIGSNERAAALTGNQIARAKVAVFVFAGVCFSVAGIFMAGRLSSAEGSMATGFEMSVIAAVVVGGTALRGGRGTLFGTVVGSLLFAVLNNSMNLLGIASYWQYVVTGVVLVTAIAIGARRVGAAEVRGAA